MWIDGAPSLHYSITPMIHSPCMLKPIKARTFRAGEARFAIVASQYNARYVEAMLEAAKAELERAGAKDVQVVRVPGAYEIPVVAARLRPGRLSAHASRITRRRSRPLRHHLPGGDSARARRSMRRTSARR